MDISTTSTTATTATLNQTSTSSNVQKNSDNSFKDEMGKVSTETKETEKDTKTDNVEKNTEVKETEDTQLTEEETEEKTQAKNQTQTKQELDKDTIMLSGEVNINAQNNDINAQNQGINRNDTIQTLLNANRELEGITQVAKYPAKIDYTTMEMNSDDAQFFADLVKDTDTTLQNVMTEIKQGTQAEVKNAEQKVKVSATLMNTLSEATKTHQPFRINFDNDVSVIIKIERDGSLSAKFIPGDKAVEEYLKQNIAGLRQKFDEQELSYNELTYTKQQQGRQEQNRRNNKEDSNE